MTLPHRRQPQMDFRCHPSKQAEIERIFAEEIIDGVEVFVDPDFDLEATPVGFEFVPRAGYRP